ncbi:MAG: bifunctional 4-hydroxy-3-methylbut-2-enyl diphosphate reductase/30S ribosomal protein S1, partial [Clostridia bacterium]|nr:bifunctional 4-hydroxy-3-methylbut-2-enyl diphosphate reductase/30S ribosomal protein S1 [Clostridia bacterium]
MEVILAKNSGFCSGVKKAYDTALSLARQDVTIYGELVHNNSVTDKLKSVGINTVERLEDVKTSKVLIRSHGVKKSDLDYFAGKGIEVIDCTCPFVKR